MCDAKIAYNLLLLSFYFVFLLSYRFFISISLMQKTFLLIAMHENEILKEEKSFSIILTLAQKLTNPFPIYSCAVCVSIFSGWKISANKNFSKRKLKVTRNHFLTKQHLSRENLMK